MPDLLAASREGGALLTATALAGGALLLALVLALVASGSLAVWAVPVFLLAALALASTRLGPLATLGLVLALQAFQLSGEAGTQPGEVVAAIAFVGYLAAWYAAALTSSRRFVTSGFDAVAVAYGTVGVLLACALGILHGADPLDFRADLLAVLPFALYLPVKEAVARHRHGALVVAGVLTGFGVLTTVQAFLFLRAIIAGAVEWWEIADVRFASTETAITSGLLFCFAGFAAAPRRWQKAALLVGVGLLLGGLTITKSRGYWVAGALGVVVTFALNTASQRKQLIAGIGLSLGALLLVALLFFSDALLLLTSGTVKRLASLSGAASQDISLLNRFKETSAAWEMVKANPILGYGWGVQVSRYDLVFQGTLKWSFLHNGYVALFFKTGLWGFAAMMTVWIGALVRAALIGRASVLSPSNRALGIGCAATLAGFSLVAITSNPFAITDQMLIVTLLMAMGHGLADRSRWLRSIGETEPA